MSRLDQPSPRKRIVIVQGHPDPAGGHFCHGLADAYAAGAAAAGHAVETIDVARLDFPLVRSRDDLERRPAPPAIAEAQQQLKRADHVLLIYPVWNGTGPALLRGFLEQTFRRDFVFPEARPGEALGFFSYFTKRKALSGRSARVIVTMQMPAFVYRLLFRPHPERNTLRVGGLSPVRESLVGSAERLDGRGRQEWVDRVTAFGRRAI